ncbi:unnamed protein product [Paramecium sonneborni]|uniref:Uncharacterized protein n=1 Tax=Paramecium sonneborni TaxID=65129 RepID=A0A8S1QV26_9CILI|nr:unnamed protein product [Paramecium sonneborni]CAD8119459.1 unnamed protein product [Paramecium sonneborni]
MASQAIAKDLYTYTNDESLQLMIYSIKGNQVCKDQRKSFNLCRSTPLGKHVEPEFCKDSAISFIDCFLGVQRNKKCHQQFQKVFDIAKTGQYAQESLEDYLKC